MMLYVLVVHEIDYFGSPVFEFQEFSESIQKLGHKVVVLDLKEHLKKGTSRKRERTRGPKESRTSKDPIDVRTPILMIPGDIFRPVAVLVHLFSLLRIFIQNKPDVVFSYSVPTSGPTVAIVGRLFGVPVVHRAIDVSHRLRPGFFDPFVKIAERLTFQLSTHVSTHNRALAEYIQGKGCRAEKIYLHYPPVDLDHFIGVNEKAKAPPTRIIFVGTLSDFTGLDEFLTSTKANQSKHPWQLRIVGDGPARASLEAHCVQLRLEDRVTFAGWRNYEELRGELEWANVAIVPFRRELLTDCALPQKAIQYMAAGLPVVSTALKGSVAELAQCQGIYFVDSPSDVFKASLTASQAPGPENKLFRSRFEKQSATGALVEFLDRVVLDASIKRKASRKNQVKND